MTRSHKELVEIASKWVKKVGFPIVASEFKTTIREIPDVVGFRASSTIMVEVKCSMSDFYADFKKPERNGENVGVGNYRLYLAEQGVLNHDKIPDGWGLLEVTPKGKVEVVKFMKGNLFMGNKDEYPYADNMGEYHHESCINSERQIMYSLLRRGK